LRVFSLASLLIFGTKFSLINKKYLMAISKKKTPLKENKKSKGIPIPAGTEQETGLTRAQTEKPKVKPSRGKREDLSKKLS